MSQQKSDTWGNTLDLQSPALVKLQMEVDSSPMSPVAGLTANLSGASIGSTPRRKLSAIHNVENMPVDEATCKYSGWSTGMSPPKDHRLMKNVMKLPDTAFSNYSTGSQPTYSSKSRGLCRRISLHPLSLNHDDRNKGTGNKENGSPNKDRTSQHSQLSFGSPSKPSISPSKFAVVRQASSGNLRLRQPLEDYDANSQDSGCCTAPVEKDDTADGFRFTEPHGTAPRRLLVDQSPRKDLFISPLKSARSALFHSFSSSSGSESIDDGFMELLECEKLDEDAQLPTGMNTLLSGPLKEVNRRSPLKEKGNSPPQNSPLRIALRPSEQKYFGRSVSFSGQQKVRNCLFSSPGSNYPSPVVSPTLEAIRAFKRPEPPCGTINPLEIKRHKSNTCMAISENEIVSHSTVKGTLFSYGFERHPVKIQRSVSETEATIKRALQKASLEPDLIGDFTKPFLLPLMDGRHQDLKTIAPGTLASLIRGQYRESVSSYTIVDCRYPYEYVGGHIKGARNLYTKDQIWKEFVDIQRTSTRSSNGDDQNSCLESSADENRNILIFHCEFSSERGPNMTRFLRNCDRTRNKDVYPALNYPEIYLLDGGYKNFFENHGDLCEPCAYQPMRDPKFESDLRLFRSKSKSWNGDNKNRQTLRSNLKRLGL